MTNDVQQLRSALKKRGPRTGRRYDDPELRAQIRRVTAGLLASRMSWWGVSKKLGISFVALKKICETKPLQASPSTNGHNGHTTNGRGTNGHTGTNGHARLTVHTAHGHRIDGLVEPGPLALVTKDGHRVEGLSIETMARLLARL